MRITKYGISLESITGDDLELIRNWRNSEHVRQNMKFKEFITSEMQANWYKQLEKANNIYFVITKDSHKIGVVNLKDINLEIGTAEAGIFIGEIEHLNTLTPILATICIMEFAFEILSLKWLRAKISSSNVKTILFNESIGYKKKIKESGDDFQYYETNVALFLEATKNIKGILDKMNENGMVMDVTRGEMNLYKLIENISSVKGIQLNIEE